MVVLHTCGYPMSMLEVRTLNRGHMFLEGTAEQDVGGRGQREDLVMRAGLQHSCESGAVRAQADGSLAGDCFVVDRIVRGENAQEVLEHCNHEVQTGRTLLPCTHDPTSLSSATSCKRMLLLASFTINRLGSIGGDI